MATLHPRLALFDADEAHAATLPVCDHYAGVEARMKKSLELQAEMGPVFDVTLDNEDGAPVGGEVEQAHLIAELLASPLNRYGRVGVRVLPVDHAHFADVVSIVLAARRRPAYLMLPKPRNAGEVQRAAAAIDAVHVRPRRPERPEGVLTAEVWFAPTLRYLPVGILIAFMAMNWLRSTHRCCSLPVSRRNSY